VAQKDRLWLFWTVFDVTEGAEIWIWMARVIVVDAKGRTVFGVIADAALVT